MRSGARILDAKVVIIGAGPAGLTAAYELTKHQFHPLVLEAADKVGGLARTEVYKGYRFDIGGHRFYTKVGEVEQLWHEMLGHDMLQVRRQSRIYYRGRFFNYPIDLANTMVNLGLRESALTVLSYARSQLRPYPREDTFEEWVCNRFGRRLYHAFFQSYTEKIWGIPCNMIQADWAAQRIRGLSLASAITDAFIGGNSVKTLVREFEYPMLGPGMLWERMQQAVERQGGSVELGADVLRLKRDGNRIRSIVVRSNGQESELGGEQFISSMPLADLIFRLAPTPPDEVLRAARALRYRAFILVGLIVKRAAVFPDNWLYVHSPHVQVARIQNFKNWSPAMVPDANKTSVGMEYFCSEGDQLWMEQDSTLVDLAKRDLAALGLATAVEVEDGVVFRQAKAYPVYDRDYREHVRVIRAFLASIENLQTLGRAGMHRYNNQDHSMLAGMLAARRLLGEDHDVWSVNTEKSYLEEQVLS